MRLWGHPLHPVLVHFPIALWTVAAAAYVASVINGSDTAAVIGRMANAGGLAMAALAMLAGLFELRSIDSQSDAQRVASWHMTLMGMTWICFLFALLLPMTRGAASAGTLTDLVVAGSAAVGFLLMVLGGRLGGRLVYEFGIAVRRSSTSADR